MAIEQHDGDMGANVAVNMRSYVYVDESQVGRQQAAMYREDIGIWLISNVFQHPVYINEDATGGGLDLMLAMARRAEVVKFAIPALPHVRGRLGDLVAIGDVYALASGLWWEHGASEDSEGRPISDTPRLRTIAEGGVWP